MKQLYEGIGEDSKFQTPKGGYSNQGIVGALNGGLFSPDTNVGINGSSLNIESGSKSIIT